MTSFRTWHYVGRGAPLFIAAPIVCLLGDGPLAEWGVVFSVLLLVALGGHGVFMAFKTARGPIRMRCPFCGEAGTVVPSHKIIGSHLRCRKCGVVRGRGFYRLELIRGPLEPWENESEPPSLPTRGFAPFLRHPPRCTWYMLALPAASIVAAAFIHRFLWFYLLIPGFWCFALGSMLCQSLQSGVLEDNHGRASRTHQPFRFWAKFAIWSFGFLFAATFPLVYALQESAAGR